MKPTKMLEPKNRCLRLNYSGDFHMDILPGVQENPFDEKQAPGSGSRTGLLGKLAIPGVCAARFLDTGERGAAKPTRKRR